MTTQTPDDKPVLGCLSIILGLAIGAPLRAWCLIRIYDWHLRATFGGPHWGVLQVWAFLVFFALLVNRSSCDAEPRKRTDGQLIVYILIETFAPLLSLGLAWLLRP
jgi:hypothetical protein